MFAKIAHNRYTKDKREKDGITTIYSSIEIDKKAKYFLFKISKNDVGPKITIKHTKNNEYKNTALIFYIVIFMIVILIAFINTFFILKKRKNKTLSTDIENVFL